MVSQLCIMEINTPSRKKENTKPDPAAGLEASTSISGGMTVSALRCRSLTPLPGLSAGSWKPEELTGPEAKLHLCPLTFLRKVAKEVESGQGTGAAQPERF